MDKFTKRTGVFWALLLCFSAVTSVSPVAYAADLPEWEHLQKAKDYRDAGKLKSAVIELKNALQKNPDSPEARLLLGEVYVGLGQEAAAEQAFQTALQLSP